ncbi:hypothetical protein NCU16558 [Neurospora crassa OR74A]|uniref:Uncharacterized protein n=1 Tax=Neurospora crassa (strain ATCC 24698 / 74-OR23-1A / CBS 708.71 / DSM 1257 / FGSC 987) TaxID=367110 RepID=V5INH5_NEUCR|nr:hypothetical protein NCU16558 [Neurospora crassa OR74A]ESA43607.1 hypothetical protein NCU16558 [Neurospora crassa OR74A]|eukprot:XP_011393694.1 hypothetical protein NCU16558 [Neurospora crassa OR74A]
MTGGFNKHSNTYPANSTIKAFPSNHSSRPTTTQSKPVKKTCQRTQTHEKPSHLGKSQLDWTCQGMVQIIDRWMHRSHFPTTSFLLCNATMSAPTFYSTPCLAAGCFKQRRGRAGLAGSD